MNGTLNQRKGRLSENQPPQVYTLFRTCKIQYEIEFSIDKFHYWNIFILKIAGSHLSDFIKPHYNLNHRYCSSGRIKIKKAHQMGNQLVSF